MNLINYTTLQGEASTHKLKKDEADRIELSVVIPCLNEAETLAICIRKVRQAIREHRISAEIIVADNGSTDDSVKIAEDLGVRVVRIPRRGYGSALMGGIAAARGRFIIMGDADDSYDFLEIPKFVEKLRQGFDLVQGCRLPNGGGTVKPGAMPFLHRWWGNPMFSFLARIWFGSPVSDIYCGLRGFTKEHFESLNQRCTGMEFATEMIIKSSVNDSSIAEVPITLHPDGRKSNTPHLRTFRDGWRTLRFFLLYSPRWLYFVPGFLFVFLGVLCYIVGLPRMSIGGITFGMHTLLFGNLFIAGGYQAILFYILTQTFAVNEGMYPKNDRLNKFYKLVRLERGLVISGLTLLAGTILLGLAVNEWRLENFGAIDNYFYTRRLVISGILLAGLGFESVLFTFFVSMLRLKRN